MSAVVDAEVLAEFLDKAQPYFDQASVLSLDQRLRARRALAQKGPPEFPDLIARTPLARRAGRELSDDTAHLLQSLTPAIWAGDVNHVFQRLEGREPPWAVEWATFWLHLVHPDVPWWARWVYQPETHTGALPLLLTDPEVLRVPAPAMCYGVMTEGTRFLDAVLASTRRWPDVDSESATWVTLASVYAVYMFTMAAWKLTTEFTQVLPPFQRVVENLLGLRRWEGRIRGRESQTD